MRRRDLEAMGAVDAYHWWFVGKRLLFERLLSDRLHGPCPDILDVGCGTGGASFVFGTYGRVWSCDRSTTALAIARRRGLTYLVAADGPALPFPDARFDIVLAFDVIEHVDDDLAMLAELRRVARPGGLIAIHVPAWPQLWSSHDEVLGHRRRYTKESLEAALRGADLEIDYLGWSSATIFPVAVVARLLRPLLPVPRRQADLFSLPGPLNALMIRIYRLEARWATSRGLPFGLSLAAVARRP
ncbi:MAG: class I SAM-dependent methyltransferase [Candidatus Dadabacteria bacterium]|nr:MAG: class I SAM-dependent methyltransferase [Candidatus Dadabacteria bacterium]